MTDPAQAATLLDLIDHISAWLAIVGFILIAADQALGKDKREHIKELVGGWWLYIETTNYTGLVKDDAKSICNLLSRITGYPMEKRKFFVVVTAINIAVFITVLLATAIFSDISESIFKNMFQEVFKDPQDILVAAAVNTLFGMFSFVLTFYFLYFMSKSNSIILISIFIILGISNLRGLFEKRNWAWRSE